jgi:hypothetical protein
MTPYSRIWTHRPVSSAAAAFIAIVLMCQAALGDERPRNLTLELDTTTTGQHANGLVQTVRLQPKIYFGSDGTAYTQFGGDGQSSVGVAVPPNSNTGSYTDPNSVKYDPVRGIMDKIIFNVSLNGPLSNYYVIFELDECRVDGQLCSRQKLTYVLQISGMTCKITAADFKRQSAPDAPNPTVSSHVGRHANLPRSSRSLSLEMV